MILDPFSDPFSLDDKEYMRSSSEVNLVLSDGDSIKLNKDRDWLVAQGWYERSELFIDIVAFHVDGYFGSLVANRKKEEIGVKYHIDSLRFCNSHRLYAKTASYRI